MWAPADARTAILGGRAPDDMVVEGNLDFRASELRRLPNGLRCVNLDVSECPLLSSLPEGLDCFELIARDLYITALPAVRVAFRLDLTGCHDLTVLPTDLRVGTLILRGCTALAELPDRLDVNFLDVTSCTALVRLPQSGAIRSGHLLARGCSRLEALPSWMTRVGRLDISECPLIATLPPALHVTDWLDVGGSAVTSVHDPTISLRWRGVAVSHDMAFRPETISARDVTTEPNVEVRRVLVERMGYERFIDDVGAVELDADTDPGGQRRLLRIAMNDDEPLVVLAVSCPSTGRRYMLRVPPATPTCRHAAAWIAGFDDPDQYNPVVET